MQDLEGVDVKKARPSWCPLTPDGVRETAVRICEAEIDRLLSWNKDEKHVFASVALGHVRDRIKAINDN